MATPAPPTRAYVRVDALAARDPLVQDVVRLQAAEARLRRLAAGNDMSPANAGASYALPALAEPTLDAQAVRISAAARAARIVGARQHLRDTVDVALDRYMSEHARRLARLLDQRRSELEATDIGTEISIERRAREAKFAQATRALDAVADQIVLVQARLSMLDAQLGFRSADGQVVEPGIFPPPEDRAKFLQQLRDFTADPKTPNIGMQVRLIVKRRAQLALVAGLQTQLDKIKADAALGANLAEAEIDRQRTAEIDRKLKAISDSMDPGAELSAQYAELGKVLSAADTVAARVGAEQARTRAVWGEGAGEITLGTIFGSAIERGDHAGVLTAADRIARQRERLEIFIHADVAAAVRDTARVRNIDAILVSGRVESNLMAGRKDLTAQFLQWTRPAVGGDNVVGGQGGEPNSATHIVGGGDGRRSGGSIP